MVTRSLTSERASGSPVGRHISTSDSSSLSEYVDLVIASERCSACPQGEQQRSALLVVDVQGGLRGMEIACPELTVLGHPSD